MNSLYQQTECLFYIKARFIEKFDPHVYKLGWRKAANKEAYLEIPNAQITMIKM